MYSNDLSFSLCVLNLIHLFGTNKSMICYVTSLKTQPSYHIQQLLVLAVTGNMSRLSTLTANGSLGAVTSKVTRLTTVTANCSIRALACDVSRLTAVVTNGLIRTITSEVTHLATITTDNMVSTTTRTSLTSRARAITSNVSKTSTIVALGLSVLSASRLYYSIPITSPHC